jgi:16S rRNA (uracil1498-N3)-methyltransferase
MNDRYEWFLEKATDIGVGEFTPLICDQSERKVIKTERFNKIIESAMKQSLHARLPKLNEPATFRNFMKTNADGQKFIAHCEESDKKSLKSAAKPGHDIIILIGPEGDFSANEITTAIENNFIPVTLGDTRLRTETAAVVACHSIAFINET